MSGVRRGERIDEDLQAVADALREHRPSLDPLRLDEIKLRAMRAGRSGPTGERGNQMRSRLTALIAAGFLAVGAGGAFALNGSIGGQGQPQSAGFSQYCEHGKGHGHCPEKGKKGKGKEGNKGNKKGKGGH